MCSGPCLRNTSRRAISYYLCPRNSQPPLILRLSQLITKHGLFQNIARVVLNNLFRVEAAILT